LKVPAILPTGRYRKIELANTVSEKRKKRRSKRKVLRGATHFYKQETVSLAAWVAGEGAGRKKKGMRSLSEQHSAASQARHVAQY